MPCLVAIDCSATTDHKFSSLVFVLCNSDEDVMARVADVQLATEIQDLVNAQFFVVVEGCLLYVELYLQVILLVGFCAI
jgi:hypothetical protein